MDKMKIIAGVRAALEATESPCEELQEQPGLQWFRPLSENYEQDYAVGELFFASDLTDNDMSGVEIVQTNLIFKRDVPPDAIDTLRAFFSKLNRLLSGGRFDAQLEDENCFAEFGHDLVLPDDVTDDQAIRAIVVALDLAGAYIGFAYEGVCGICAHDLTVEAAMELLYGQN